MLPEDGGGDDLKDEGGGEHGAGAGDGEAVVLGLLGVEGGEDGESAARQEDGGAQHHQAQTLPLGFSLWDNIRVSRVITCHLHYVGMEGSCSLHFIQVCYFAQSRLQKSKISLFSVFGFLGFLFLPTATVP